jgi:hypothetical protein
MPSSKTGRTTSTRMMLLHRSQRCRRSMLDLLKIWRTLDHRKRVWGLACNRVSWEQITFHLLAEHPLPGLKLSLTPYHKLPVVTADILVWDPFLASTMVPVRLPPAWCPTLRVRSTNGMPSRSIS